MQPKSDVQLLREYSNHGIEAAFAELVVRHTNLVYSAALRQVELQDLAAEVTQRAFIGLARNAQSISNKLNENGSLAGWLCRSARNICLNHRRDEFRRRSREKQAMETLDSTPDTAPDWEHLGLVLDDAMSELSEPDYDALVMRFFNNQDLRSVGQALGVSDDAAQKRVTRAIDRLRGLFARRGIIIGAGGLTAAISAHAVQAAPAGLAVMISTTATTLATTLATASITQTITMTTLQKTLIAASLIVSVTAPLVIQHRSRRELSEENAMLRQQIEQQTDRLARMATDNEQLSNRLLQTNNPEAFSDSRFSELLRLRGEVGRLRQRTRELEQLSAEKSQPKSSPAEDQLQSTQVFPRQSWSPVGFETPQDALQSSAWAIRQGDTKAFLDSTTPGFRARFKNATTMEGLNGISLKTKEYRIVNRDERAQDQIVLHVSFETFDGAISVVPICLKKIDGQWKVSLPGEM